MTNPDSKTPQACESAFRRRPVEIEAIQFVTPFRRAQEFLPNLRIIRDGRRIVGGYYNVERDGRRVAVGDWILRAGDHFETMSPEVFERTWEAADDGWRR